MPRLEVDHENLLCVGDLKKGEPQGGNGLLSLLVGKVEDSRMQLLVVTLGHWRRRRARSQKSWRREKAKKAPRESAIGKLFAKKAKPGE